MSYREIDYKSFDEFIHDISPYGNLYELNLFEKYIFRGQSEATRVLIPSVLRLPQKEFLRFVSIDYELDSIEEYYQIECEFIMLKSFYSTVNIQGHFVPYSPLIQDANFEVFNESLRDVHNFIWYPKSLRDLAALAQHYGMPTRLLDWSKNIYIALYFATIKTLMRCYENNNLEKLIDGSCFSLWMLNPTSIINASYYIKEFSPLKIFIPPYYGNPNLSAQKGVFTYWEKQANSLYDLKGLVDREPLEDKIKKIQSKKYSDLLIKINMPKNEIPKILKYISELGYHAASIFPGYNGATLKMKEDLAIDHISYLMYKCK